MRHAKSSWSHASLADHERPLNKRGKRDAPRMAQFLAAQGYVPDLVISSTAMRARTTAELFVEHCPGINAELALLSELYHAAGQVYLDVLSRLNTDAATILMIGHNPGLEQLVQALSSEWHRMPTAATAVFSIDIDEWSAVEQGPGNDRFQLVDVWRPKEINE